MKSAEKGVSVEELEGQVVDWRRSASVRSAGRREALHGWGGAVEPPAGVCTFGCSGRQPLGAAEELVLVHVLREGVADAELEAMAGMGVRWLDCGVGPTEPGCGCGPLAKLQSDADLDALWFCLERSDAVQHPYRLDVATVRG